MYDLGFWGGIRVYKVELWVFRAYALGDLDR